MKFYGIYKTTNKVNGKMYIGKHITNNLDDGYLGSGVVMQHAIKKYGEEAFEKQWLEFAENAEDLNYLERMYVDEEWLARPDTYNLKLGGDGGWDYINNTTPGIGGKKLKGTKHSEDFKQKCRAAKEGRKNPMFGVESPFKGKQHSKKTREFLSVPVAVYKDGVFLFEAPSMRAAAKMTSCHPSKITAVCKGDRKHTKGFVFRYTTKQGQFGRLENGLDKTNN